MATDDHPTRGGSEKRLSSFLAKYEPEIEALARGVRERMRARLPGAVELVYDNYNGLVIGYGPTDRSSEAVASITLYPRWVRLFFLRGASLPDPEGLLEGNGKQVRSVLLESVARVDDPPVAALIAEAAARSVPPMDAAGPGQIVIKSVSEKQRPRRPR